MCKNLQTKALWRFCTKPRYPGNRLLLILPFDMRTWTSIPNANSPSYNPPVLYETTYFVRCVHREGCSLYLESNIATIEAGSVANAQINGPGLACVGETATYTAGPTGTGAAISWQVSATSGAGPQIILAAHSYGIVNYEFTVEHSRDGRQFEALGNAGAPQAYLGSMNYNVYII